MDLWTIAKFACFFVLVASGETLNGIARTVCLNRRLGVSTAKRLSMLSAIVLCLAICNVYVPILDVTSQTGLVWLGVSLSFFMLFFDIVLGRLVVRLPWSQILDEFNIIKGNLMGVGMLAMAFCPLLSSKFSRLY